VRPILILLRVLAWPFLLTAVAALEATGPNAQGPAA